MKISIIVPVYYGEKTLRPLFQAIKEAIENKYDYELIFVYDCGPDKSWDVICELKKEAPDIIKAVKLSRNFGQHNAIICGIKFAEGDYVVTMDEDLQHSPDDIEKLLEKQREADCDVVYGEYDEKNHSIWRNFTSNTIKVLLKKAIPELPEYYSAFRLMKIDTAKAILGMHNSYTFLDGYLSWITSSYACVTVKHSKRFGGQSGYSLMKLIEHSINIFVTFSNLPIRFVTLMSILIFLVTSTYSIYILIRKFIADDFQIGFPILIIVMSMGIGFILLSIGIVGEYIYRINMKTTKRPNYKVGEIL